MKQRSGRLDQRGAISVMVALGTVVLIGAAALAIDLGMLLQIRTDSQRAADAAALAGAQAFVDAPGATVAQTAEAWAIQQAARNPVANVAPALQPSDIVVDLSRERVTVTVPNNQARGNAIGLGFARILGINTADVGTVAVAEAWPVAAVTCVLPLFLVDRWDEIGGGGYYDPGIDYYEPYNPHNVTSTYTGYDDTAIGTHILIKPAQGPPGGLQPNESWYFPFDAANIPGGANYKDSITGCIDPSYVYAIGDSIKAEPGVMNGPTVQGFTDLINQDPTAAWDPGLECVVDQSQVGANNPLACRGSPRLRPVPMLDPTQTPPPGKSSWVRMSNFAGLFVSQVVGNDVYGIFAGYGGVLPVPPGANNAGSVSKKVVLIG